MELNQVYVKTAKGQEEIQSRTYKLPFNLRKLLIMVDGHSTTGEIIERLTALGHTALLGNMIPAFVELEAGEFIAFCTSPTSQTAPASNAAGGALSAASLAEQATAPPFNLDKAKNFTRSILLSTLDPSAGQQIERIEALGNYVQIFFDGRKAVAKRSLAEVEDRLDAGRFFRANRAAIISLKHIGAVKALSKGKLSVVMQSGTEVVLSERKSVQFKAQLSL